MAFVFLREPGESNNEAVARCAEQALAAGPMASTIRVADYIAFLDAFAGRGKAIKDTATSCAMFGGACCIHAEAQEPRPPPPARAITTWAGVRGFVEDDPRTPEIEGAWIPADKLPNGVLRGDLPYICSTRGQMPLGNGKVYTWTHWQAAANGHLIVALDDGWIVRTAEGGGSPGGTGCRLSAAAKDLRTLSRPFRGVWRPNLMPGRRRADADTEPAPPPRSEPPAFLPLRRHDYGDSVRAWQRRLVAAGYELPKSTRENGTLDGDFGGETEQATKDCQRDNLLPQTGVVDRKTWEHAEAKR